MSTTEDRDFDFARQPIDFDVHRARAHRLRREAKSHLVGALWRLALQAIPTLLALAATAIRASALPRPRANS